MRSASFPRGCVMLWRQIAVRRGLLTAMVDVPRWLPNAISALRIVLVPVWVLCAEWANRAGEPESVAGVRPWAVAVLLAIGASDLVDGWVARRFALQSHLGATLDAVADKLAQVVVFTYLALRNGPAFAAVPPWFFGALIARDVVLLIGCGLVRWRRGRVHVEHRAHGKLTSLLLFALAIVCTAGFGDRLTQPAFWTAAAVVGVSAALYVRDGVRQFVGAPAAA